MSPNPPPASFLRGLFASLPIALGYFPIAFSFGVAATRLGFSPVEAVGFSVLIYAGASQFLALALLSSGAPIVVAGVTLAAMNLRHIVYGPALLTAAGADAATRRSWGWAFGLTDEVFGTALGALMRHRVRFSEAYMFGLGLGAYAAWVSGTAAGAIAGGAALESWPVVSSVLGFMLTALFLSLLLSILSRRAMLPILVSVAAAVAGVLFISSTTGILAGIVCGAIAGAFAKGNSDAS